MIADTEQRIGKGERSLILPRVRIPMLCLAWCAIALGADATTLPAQLSAPAVRYTREVVLDANKEQLVGFTSMVLSPAGGFVIAQGKWQLLFFNDSGKRIASVGRRGQGPGEFTDVGRFGWYADTLWVADEIDDRVTLFSPTGKYYRAIRTQSSFESSYASVAARGHSELVSFSMRALVPGAGLVGSVTAIPQGMGYFVAVSEDRKRLTIISEYSVPMSGALVRTSTTAGGGGSVAVSQIPHLPQPLSWVSSDGGRIGTAVIESKDGSGQVKLRVVTPLGATILERSYAFTGVPIPRQAIDPVIDQIRGRKNLSAQALKSLEDQVRERFPRTYSPVTSLRLTKDGAIWLELGNHLASRTWLRLDARGTPVHTMSVPANVRFEESDGDVIWATETDADDLRSVIRYRIQR